MVILVADDHDDGREATMLVLEMDGHTVVGASNGRDAVETATVMRPDLILLDLNMPVMDGLTAISILRAQPFTASIRIIVVSANGSDPEWQKRAQRCGCDECLGKPLDFQCLSDLIHQGGA
jgi:two-component system, cell cycle response regulator DivK